MYRITLKMIWTFVKYVLFWLIVHLMCSTTHGAAMYRNNPEQMWPTRIAPYVMNAGTCIPPKHVRMILKAMRVISKHTCLTFIPKGESKEKHDRYIWINETGIYVQGSSGVNEHYTGEFACGCNLRPGENFYHLLMHKLGFADEYERLDRPERFMAGMNINSDGIFSHLTPYDSKSVMIGNGYVVPHTEAERELISVPDHYDYLAINKVYRCLEMFCTSNGPPTCLYDGYVGPRCKCVCIHGLGGDTCREYDKSTSNYGCGGYLKSFEYGKPSSYTLTSSKEKRFAKCTWVFVGEKGRQLTLDITSRNPDSTENHYLIEVRYDLPGQPGTFSPTGLSSGPFTTYNKEDSRKPIVVVIFRPKPGPVYWFEAKIWQGGPDDKPSDDDGATERGYKDVSTGGHTRLSFNYIDFENDEFRGFEQTGTIDWLRQEGTTPSTNTGPSFAAEGRYYAYMETSYPTTSFDTAILTTAGYYDGNDDVCVQFSYHIFGSAPGTLQVLTKSTDTGTEYAIWTNYDSVEEWRTASLIIKSADVTGPYVVLFKAIPTGIKSDVGIDDLLIGIAPCHKMRAGTGCSACLQAVNNCQTADKKECKQSTVATKFSVVDELKSPSSCKITTRIDVGRERYTRTCLLNACKYGHEDKKTIIFKSECEDKYGSKCKVCCMAGSKCTVYRETKSKTAAEASEIIKSCSLLLFCVFISSLFPRLI